MLLGFHGNINTFKYLISRAFLFTFNCKQFRYTVILLNLKVEFRGCFFLILYNKQFGYK